MYGKLACIHPKLPLLWYAAATHSPMICACFHCLQAKCHQYWPEAGSVTIGDLAVTLIESQELAYYSIRTFRMNKVGGALLGSKVTLEP